MQEFWLFIGTLVVGSIWLAVAPFVFGGIEYGADHAGGWLFGMTPEEVDRIRKMKDERINQ